ncbi:hypothetical protein ABC270_16735 [Curtobacterium sp. 1P10AnD]|uniref:hypothetical protein n=1 Tax=Curtobacterium sp. 1P10AnD TaxID=3132283 RepID=UPI0039A0EA9C
MERRTRTIVALGATAVAAMTMLVLSSCSLFGGDDSAPAPTRTAAAGPDGGGSRTATPAPTPSATPVLAPGSVAAETDVVSKSGETSLHVRIVQRADGLFDAELSDYRTTNPQPIALQFRHRPADYADGYDTVVRSQVQWSGTSAPATVPLDDAGRTPDYLSSAVLVPMPNEDGSESDDRPWVGSVLAVGSLDWTLPNPYPGLRVTVGKARPGAYGWVRDSNGTPTSYGVSHGDELTTVTERFGVTPAQLRWLNPYLETRGAEEWLIEGTTLNLDPANR